MAVRWGEVIEASKDAGPYKLAKVRADGKEFDCVVWDLHGSSSNPVVGSHVAVMPIDGDEGKALILPGVPPKERWDQLKEGEIVYGNVLTKTNTKLNADGDMVQTIKRDWIVNIDGKVEIRATGGIKINGETIKLNEPD